MKDFSCEKNANGYVITEYKGKQCDLVIPEGVIEIAKEAFYKSNIKSITFPKSLKIISSGAFYYCEKLQEINFAKNGNLEEIDEYAFSCCYSLKKVVLPNNLSFLWSYAFEWCTSLESAVLPASIKTVKAEIFSNCDRLSKITVVGNSIPKNWHFEWNKNNKKIEFINGENGGAKTLESNSEKPEVKAKPVTSKPVESKPIVNSKPQEKIKQPIKTEGVSNSNASAFKTVKSEPISPLNGYKCNDISEFVIKESYDGKFIASVKDKNVKTIVVPKEIGYIGAYENGYSFSGCTSLETFIGHENLKSLWDGTFSGCTSLKTVKISENTSVWSYVFDGCTSLETAYINGNTHDYAYANSGVKKVVFSQKGIVISKGVLSNTPIESLHIPEIYYIGERAFKNCKQLKTVVLENGVTDFMPYAFYGCSKLEKIVIPKSASSIYDSAFEDCISLKSVSFSEGLYRIGEQAFKNCKSLENVVIPNSVDVIGNSAFNNCVALKSVTFSADSSVTIFDSAFYGCENLKEIVIPKKVYFVGKNAFDSRYIKKITVIRDKNSHPSILNMQGFNKDWISKDYRNNVKVEVIYK